MDDVFVVVWLWGMFIGTIIWAIRDGSQQWQRRQKPK